MWFDKFAKRGGGNNYSGFEHVFVGKYLLSTHPTPTRSLSSHHIPLLKENGELQQRGHDFLLKRHLSDRYREHFATGPSCSFLFIISKILTTQKNLI